MKAVFYDRKNKCEVSSDQLMSINLIEEYLVTDCDDSPAPGQPFSPEHTSYVKERRLGELGYKSKKCPKHSNWDFWTNTNELIFLRLEE